MCEASVIEDSKTVGLSWWLSSSLSKWRTLEKKPVSGEETKSDFGRVIWDTHVEEWIRESEIQGRFQLEVDIYITCSQSTCQKSRVKGCQSLFTFTRRRWGMTFAYLGSPSEETQETQVWSLSQEDPLEEEMATHSRILAWRIPWTEKPHKLQFKRLTKSWTWLSDYAHTWIGKVFRHWCAKINFNSITKIFTNSFEFPGSLITFCVTQLKIMSSYG